MTRMPTVKGTYDLLWQLSDRFERNVPGWRHSLVVWRAKTTDRGAGAKSVLLANLCAGRGRHGLVVRAVVDVRHPGSPSTVRIRDFVAGVEEKLRARGYAIAADPLPEQPLLSWREIPVRQLHAEHLFLSELLGKTVSPLARVSTTQNFSTAIAAASSWALYESEWTMDRKIRVCGREATAHARVRIAPPPTKDRSISSEISVQVWLPWSRRGGRPLWLKQARMILARQLRAGGLRVERISTQPPLVFASRPPPRDPKEVMRKAKHVGSLELGDEA